MNHIYKAGETMIRLNFLTPRKETMDNANKALKRVETKTRNTRIVVI